MWIEGIFEQKEEKKNKRRSQVGNSKFKYYSFT